MQWKVDLIGQLVMTSSVVGPRRGSKALSKVKPCTKKGHGHCLVVCCQSDLLPLSEFQWNHYIKEVCSANQWDAPKIAVLAAGIGQTEWAKFLSTTSDCMSQNQYFKSWMNWAMKFCLICHIRQTSFQPITTSLSISTTFCRENASTTSRMQKTLSKILSNPEALILCYRNKQTYFSLAKICWL